MAESRYSNAGLSRAEALFIDAHPRAAQYLDQAPVLVMWVLPWAQSASPSAESFAKIWVRGHCEDGVDLKRFLRAANFSAPMRHLKASAILPSRAAVYRMLARMEPTVLARIMPATAKAQRTWISALHEWLSFSRNRTWGISRDPETMFRWCAEHLLDFDSNVIRNLIDFQRGGEFSTSWGMKRALEEMDLWHARITLESQLKGLPVGPDEPIDLGQHRDRFEVDGYALTALRTPRQIAEEGTAMRHCVATYIKRVFDGECHIVSITRQEKRVATLELAGPKSRARRWSVVQLRGPRNSQPSHTVAALAALFSEALRDAA